MKDMELYDSFIRETTDLLGAPTQKWAYKERDAWKDNGERETSGFDSGIVLCGYWYFYGKDSFGISPAGRGGSESGPSGCN